MSNNWQIWQSPSPPRTEAIIEHWQLNKAPIDIAEIVKTLDINMTYKSDGKEALIVNIFNNRASIQVSDNQTPDIIRFMMAMGVGWILHGDKTTLANGEPKVIQPTYLSGPKGLLKVFNWSVDLMVPKKMFSDLLSVKKIVKTRNKLEPHAETLAKIFNVPLIVIQKRIIRMK